MTECVCVFLNTNVDSSLFDRRTSVFSGSGLYPWSRRVTVASGSIHDPSHVNTHFSGPEPGKNRAVCLGFGGKSVSRNVTLRAAWGGEAWHDCSCLCLSRNIQLLRQQDKKSGIMDKVEAGHSHALTKLNC